MPYLYQKSHGNLKWKKLLKMRRRRSCGTFKYRQIAIWNTTRQISQLSKTEMYNSLISQYQEMPESKKKNRGKCHEISQPGHRNYEVFDGMLNEATVAEALHTLGHSASGTERVYLHLSLSDRLLSDIHVLSKYIHLEKLNLSYNKISDLSCISYMPYLLELDVSHNALTTYFDFRPPKNLQVSCKTHL
uniref:Uncharacterized protein n=1 Tax=Naja naja TaxID=35670 RepID=A0A8C6XJX3_NAJNA